MKSGSNRTKRTNPSALRRLMQAVFGTMNAQGGGGADRDLSSATSPVLEALEGRTLLSAVVQVTPVDISATEGDTIIVWPSATVSDSDTGCGVATQYSITAFQIDWGDGQQTTITDVVQNYDGSWSPSGMADTSHVYAEESGATPFDTTVLAIASDGNIGSAEGTADIADAPLEGQGIDNTADQGQLFSGDVATVVDNNPNGTTGELSARIDWGEVDADGNPVTSTGTIDGGGAVQGEHKYNAPGTYTVNTTVTDEGGSSTTITSTITVAAATLDSMTVTSNYDGSETATVSDTSSPGPLYLTMNSSNVSTVSVTGVVSPTMSSALAVYGLYSGGVKVADVKGTATLDWSKSNTYSIVGGIDQNGNGVLDEGEITRQIDLLQAVNSRLYVDGSRTPVAWTNGAARAGIVNHVCRVTEIANNNSTVPMTAADLGITIQGPNGAVNPAEVTATVVATATGELNVTISIDYARFPTINRVYTISFADANDATVRGNLIQITP